MNDIIPSTGERGQFVITDKMLTFADASSMEEFYVILKLEAQRRNLNLAIEHDIYNYSQIVKWWPH